MNRFHAIDAETLRLLPGDRVLDVGCGTGRHVLELSRTPGSYVGVDWSREDLRSARGWYQLSRRQGKAPGRISLMQGDGEHLPYGDGVFDRVLCTEVLEHVSNDRAVLAELVRVLRPGGVLAVSVPDELSERLLWRLSKRYRTAPDGHVRIYGRREILRLLREGGVRPYSVRFRHSLEACYWLLGAILAPQDVGSLRPARLRVVAQLRRALSTQRPCPSAWLDRIDQLTNFLLPKSIVLYARKPGVGWS